MNGNETYGPSALTLDAFDSIECITGVITNIVEKAFDNGRRWIITVDDDWTLIVNDTNYRVLKKVYGAESDGWLHKPITAYKGTLRARGVEREGICLRVPEDVQPADKLDPINAELSEVSAANAEAHTNDITF